MSDVSIIGARVRAERRLRRLSQTALGEAAGLSLPTIFRLEHGMVAPTLETIAAVARALGLTVSELIDSDGEEAA